MKCLTIYEFDFIAPEGSGVVDPHGSAHRVDEVPQAVFDWLMTRCALAAKQGEKAWLKLQQPNKRRSSVVVQVTSYVGIICAPNGFQIEVLPKTGKISRTDEAKHSARKCLLKMLCCLRRFRHIKIDHANLLTKNMPLLEVFIHEFLAAVEHVIKRGLRSNYVTEEENLLTLRGKLLMSQHIRHNVCRADRFFTAHDEYSLNRPENRLLHSALRRVLSISISSANQRLGRELGFVFSDIPFPLSRITIATLLNC